VNERIKQLALECGAWHQVYEPQLFMHDKNFDISKFAELIVLECVREFVRKQPVSVNVSNRAAHVFKHFGVEE
jgi:hypothetical protein